MIMQSVQSHKTTAGSSMRGNMVTKSGPLSPLPSKWIAQYNIMLNMNAHYKKISSVKSVVDTSTPKCFYTNTKKRDSLHRMEVAGCESRRTISRPQTARRSSVTSTPRTRPDTARLPSTSREKISSFDNVLSGYDEMAAAEDSSLELSSLNVEMEALQLLKTEDFDSADVDVDKNIHPNNQVNKNALADRIIRLYGVEEDFREANLRPTNFFTVNATVSRPEIAGPKSVFNSLPLKQASRTKTQGRSDQSGDVMESRAHAFKSTTKSFSPRILNKPKAVSKLTQSKHYYRPTPKKPIRPLLGVSLLTGVSPSASDIVMDSSANCTRSSTPLEDWRLTCDNDDRFETKSGEFVPKLDISMDQDHLRWIKKQQGLKMERQNARSSEANPKILAPLKSGHTEEESTTGKGEQLLFTEEVSNSKTDFESSDSEIGSKKREDEQHHEIQDHAEKKQDDITNTSKKESDNEMAIKNKIKSKEEQELVYLKFVQDVTADVLTTGCVSETILKEVITRRAEQAGEEVIKSFKAKELHQQLRKDLGFSEDYLADELADTKFNKRQERESKNTEGDREEQIRIHDDDVGES